MPSISIVIAARNEEASIERVFERCRRVLSRCTDEPEIVMVDDASTDATGRIMERLRHEHSDITRVIRHERNLGIARTFEAAYRAGSGDFVLDVPGDGEYPPEVLEKMLPLLDRYDIIVAARSTKRYGLYRGLVSSAYRWLPWLLFGIDLVDPGSIKCRKREVIREVRPQSKSVFAEVERSVRAIRRGYRYGVVMLDPEPRGGGEPGGARPSLVLHAATDLLALFGRLVVLRQAP